MPLPGSAKPDGPAVLLVDDRPENLLALEETLAPLVEETGVRLLRAGTAEEALRHLLQEDGSVAVVLLDVMMSGGDGREAYRELRTRADLLDVPVVMMSAAVQSDGLDPSIAAFLRKPFDLDHLVVLVTNLIGPSHADGRA